MTTSRRRTDNKRFRDHSARWQRARLREGVDPKRWDRYTKLSAKTRREVGQLDYARGRSVTELRRKTRLRDLVDKLLARARKLAGYTPERSIIERNVRHLSTSDISKINNLSQFQMELDAVRRNKRATAVLPSPYWYH